MYNKLRDDIAAVIKPNWNGEITGQLMQQKLLEIVDNMDLGGLFLGFAGKVTEPDTEANGFYFSTEAGTYTNFYDKDGNPIVVGEMPEIIYRAKVNDVWAWKHETFGGTYVKANPEGEPTETLEKLQIGGKVYTAPQGEQGEQGEQGDPGPANTITIGTVQSGEEAAANITGESPEQVLNLTLPKGNKGDKGDNAVNPFKGWYTTDNIPLTGQEGDYCNVSDTSVIPHTVTIYRWDTTQNAFVDTGETPDTATGETFASGETLQEVAIDDSHLANPKNEADPTMPVLANAEDVLQLKAKLEGVTASEVKVNAVVGTNVTTGAYVSGETGLLVTPGSSASSYAYFELAIPQGTKSIRFTTGTKTSGVKIGYSIGHYEENVYVPTRTFYFDVAETTPPSGIVEKVIEVFEGETTFMATVAAVSTYASITLDKFYCYLQGGDTVVGLIGKSKVEVVDNLNTNDATKALSAKQGKELNQELFGETEVTVTELTTVAYDWRIGNVNSQYDADSLKYSVSSKASKAKGLTTYRGKKLVITNRETGPTAYFMILKGSYPSHGTYTLKDLVDGGYLSNIHNTGDTSVGYNGWVSVFEVSENGGTAEIIVPDDAYAILATGNIIGDAYTNRAIAKIELVEESKLSDGILDELQKKTVMWNDLSLENGDIDSDGNIVPSTTKIVTGYLDNGKGFYIELMEGYYVERAVLYDKNGKFLTYNYYVRSTSGHDSTDNNCWGNNEQLSQFLVRLVLKSESDTNVPLNNIVKRFVYLNDKRLTKVLPQNLDYAKFMYKLHQLTNVTWVPVEKAQHNYGGDGVNNTLWFLKDSVVTGVPYSTETEYSKFIGIDVAFRTFLSAAKNKRSVIYTECVEQSHTRSAYGFTYHGEANYTGNFYGSVCTGLTSYLLGYNVNEYIGNMDTKLGDANKIAHGKETLYWGDDEVTIDDLAQQLQPMDIILNSSHISVISDVYKDEYGVVQYVVWTEQTGPTARMIPYSKEMLAKRFANKEFSIYRLPSETWADALAKDVEITKDIIQNSFFDFEPKDVDVDPDISTFEGEYAVFVDNADNDNTDSYNNYKAFLNIHRNSAYTTLQIFGEDEDVSTAVPIEVNISTNSGTFIYNSSIYADDSIDKDDWIVVDLMQLSPKLAAGKYKARVVGSNIESGFTHFQIVSISMTPTWNGNYVTRIDFNVDGGNVVAVSQQTHIMPYKIKNFTPPEQEQGYVTFSGDGWNASSFYIKLVVSADYGTAVKKINKSSYSS